MLNYIILYLYVTLVEQLNCYSFVGGAIWHPRCGPSPTENGTIINGGNYLLLFSTIFSMSYLISSKIKTISCIVCIA